MMARFRFIPLALVALLGTALTPSPNSILAQERDITQSSGRIEIARHQGRLIRLTGPAVSVFIANPEIADVNVKSSRMVYVFGKTTGMTTLFAVDRNENIIADIDVSVSHDLSSLDRAIESLLPASGVATSSVQGAIVLEGSVASAADAEDVRRLTARFLDENEEVINRIAVTDPNQINLRVRIAEVSRTAARQLGLNFDITKGDFSFTSGETFLQNPAGLAGGGFTLLGDQFGAGLLRNIGIGNANLNILFDALEEIGMAKTLAEPNLTAMSGETASFLAGGEFPIAIIDEDGRVAVEFKEFGISLSFTPTLINNGRINLHVRPEVSQLTAAGAVSINGLSISALTTRRAETTVELASGRSFAIAGLYQEDFQDSVRQIPFIADVPLLGELFKSEQFRRNETELIILVTPYIVKPFEDRDVPLPTDPFTKSNVALKNKRPRNLSATLSRTVDVPLGPANGTQTGAATYILD